MTKITTKQLIKEMKHPDFIASSISKKYGVSEAALSQRIAKLRLKGVVKEQVRSNYKQYTLNRNYTKKLKKNLSSRNGRKSANLSRELRFEPHKFMVKFPVDRQIDSEKLKLLFPIKKKLKNWNCYMSLDKSMKLTTKSICFYIKFDTWDSDLDNSKARAISLATTKAIGLNQQHSLRINIKQPEFRQEIRIKHPLITKMFKDHKGQFYWKGGKKVYMKDKTCLEVYNQPDAERIAENLSIVDAKSDIISAINGLVQVQQGYAIAIAEHLAAIKSIKSSMDNFIRVMSKFEKKIDGDNL